jgi:hypothetical protein
MAPPIAKPSAPCARFEMNCRHDAFRLDRRVVRRRQCPEGIELRLLERSDPVADTARSVALMAAPRDFVGQCRQHQLRVADHRSIRLVACADDAGIDVDMHNACTAGRRMLPSFRCDGARPATDENDDVGRIHHGAGFDRPAVAADDADRKRVGLGDAALSADRGRDRRLQRFGEGL